MVKKLPLSVLRSYPNRTACLKVGYKGKTELWFIGADPAKDNEKTLTDHLKLHFPDGKLIGYVIK